MSDMRLEIRCSGRRATEIRLHVEPELHRVPVQSNVWTEAAKFGPIGHMDIERIAPILTVDDLATAIAEHTGVLGLRVVMNMGWIAFLADPVGRQIGLMTHDATASVNPDVSVFVDDVEAAHTAAVASGVEIVHPLSTEEWGVRRFFYRDSSGRVVNVGTHT